MAQHLIDKIALAYVHCSCGWSKRLWDIKGKTDEQLAAECKAAHEDHTIDMES
jgi:hypothetical protein